MYVNIVGNLTEDPELRFTTSGAAYARMRVAENHRFTNKNGDTTERTSFHTVVAWRDLAENAAESLTKGMRVMISGRQEDRSYETNTGEQRTVKEITADEIGPSLRWARADVQRIRNGGGGDTSARNRTSGSSRAAAEPTVAVGSGSYDPYNSDQDPF